jgi:hypothetical protein
MVSTTQHQYQQSSRFEAALQHSSNSKKTKRTSTQYKYTTALQPFESRTLKGVLQFSQNLALAALCLNIPLPFPIILVLIS